MAKIPHKIVDRTRNKIGIVVSSLEDLILQAKETFGIQSPVKILMESDGTIVNNEEYFTTCERNTSFLILKEDEDFNLSKMGSPLNCHKEEHQKNSTNSPSSNSPPSTPPKKKSKTDEFKEVVKSCNGNYALLVAEGSSIITNLEQDNERLRKDLKIANSKLDARPFLEKLKRKVIPPSIENAAYINPRDKWYISIRFQMTHTAKVLLARCNGKYDVVKALATLFVQMFRGLPKTLSHNDYPKPLELNEDEWKELFNYCEIFAVPDQTLVIEALKPITTKESTENKVTSHFMLQIWKTNLNLDTKSEEDVTMMIKNMCEVVTELVSNFYYPTNGDGTYRNEVFFEVNVVEDKIVESLIRELKEKLKKGEDEVPEIRKFGIYIPHHVSDNRSTGTFGRRSHDAQSKPNHSQPSGKGRGNRGNRGHRGWNNYGPQ